MDGEFIDNLCKRFKCITADIRKLHMVKEGLNQLQRRQTFAALFGNCVNGSDVRNNSKQMPLNIPKLVENKLDIQLSLEDVEEEELEMCPEFPEDKWQGYFEGFEMLTESKGMSLNENAKCIQLTRSGYDDDIKQYLRMGVRVFMIDLFAGTQWENQSIIINLRKNEISVSKEVGFPVVSTIFARLSPRYQYTGIFKDIDSVIELKKADKVILTADREYSNKVSADCIYVNARFLLPNVKKYDYILIGNDIQLIVLSNNTNHLSCCVARGGFFKSRTPVLFPKRCSKFHLSCEELEDITFANEAGINVIVSDIVGSLEYLNNLQNAMNLLKCNHLRLFARIVLNEIRGCDGDLNWVAKKYDGLLVEVAPPSENQNKPVIMHLCPDAECLMKLMYNAKKPIILDPLPIAQQTLRVDPTHYFHIFYYPDKYLVRCDRYNSAFYFSFLQNAIFETIPPMTLAPLPYCDESHTGADALARAVTAATFEMQAVAIAVCGTTTRMVQKLSHYRPNVPIIFVSHMRSAEDYVLLYHNLHMLPFTNCNSQEQHDFATYRKAVYAVAYLKSRKIAKSGRYIIIVHKSDNCTTFPDKFISYKFDIEHFPMHLSKLILPLAK